MISESQLKRYCSGDGKDIENYDLAISDTQKWEIHHRLELTEDGDFAYSHKDLKERGMYYDRPSDELIFLTASEHRRLHKKGKKLTAEHCARIGAGNKKPYKHHDITVSCSDDYNAYMRQYKRKMKALAANK